MNNHEIKRRIESVKETVKITRAMFAISMAKLRRARGTFPFADRFYEESLRILKRVSFAPSPFFKERGKRAAFIVIGGDKGLCGDYNQRLFESAVKALKTREERYLFIVGGAARDRLSKVGIEADVEFLHSAENPSPEASFSIAADLMNLYREDMLDELFLVYSAVEGDHTCVPVRRLLPFTPTDAPPFEEAVTEQTVDRAVYEYLAAAIYRALVSASLSEHFSRVLAMPQATENGEKMIAELTTIYNKARQESITRALADVGSRESKNGKRI